MDDVWTPPGPLKEGATREEIDAWVEEFHRSAKEAGERAEATKRARLREHAEVQKETELYRGTPIGWVAVEPNLLWDIIEEYVECVAYLGEVPYKAKSRGYETYRDVARLDLRTMLGLDTPADHCTVTGHQPVITEQGDNCYCQRCLAQLEDDICWPDKEETNVELS